MRLHIGTGSTGRRNEVHWCEITTERRTVGNTGIYRPISYAQGVFQPEVTLLLQLLPSRLPHWSLLPSSHHLGPVVLILYGTFQ